MSETPREPREVWNEVGRQFGELGRMLRGHLSPDAARTPSDPTDVPDPERPGWAGPTEVTADPDQAAWADPATADPGPAGADPGWAGPTAAEPGSPGPTAAPDPARPGEAEGVADPWAAATDPGRGGTAGQDTGSTADPGAGRPGWTGYASGHQGWRGRAGWGTGGSRWAGPAGGAPGWARTGVGRTDWEAMRESVRRLGESAQRFATQAGDAVRDPEVLDSAQRAARTLGDAVTSTVEGLATELRQRARSPRWSDPSTPRPAERPPAAPADDDPTP